MSYLVLARKWRPRNFEDIIGQEHITQTLKNAVSTGKTAHAFIFSGPRGVGKTSTARVISKALNCEKGPGSGPCSECVSCREITEGKSLDVMEIDAASHTGVNDVREIIENIKYLPTSGKNKIYIIDEAHMLSQSAFNALLKTLEEPPPHVLFILATTEVHKIPVTILSRCQRYDFRRVSVEKIKDTLRDISNREQIKLEDETLFLIAQEADGSMRDALSLTDQLIATYGNEISHVDALNVLGAMDRSLVKAAVKTVIGGDPKEAVSVLHEALEKGVSPRRFAEDLLREIRNLLLIKTCGREVVSDISEEDKDGIEKIASTQNARRLEMIFKILLEEAESVQRSLYPQMAVEMTIIKLTSVGDFAPIDDILERIEKLSNLSGDRARRDPEMDESNEAYSSSGAEDMRKTPKTYAENPLDSGETKTKQAVNKPGGTEEFIAYLKTKKPVLARRLQQASKVDIDDDTFVIVCESGSPELEHLKKNESKKALANYLEEYYSGQYGIRIEEIEPSAKGKRDIRREKREKMERIQNNRAVKEAVEVFGGRIVSTKPK